MRQRCSLPCGCNPVTPLNRWGSRVGGCPVGMAPSGWPGVGYRMRQGARQPATILPGLAPCHTFPMSFASILTPRLILRPLRDEDAVFLAAYRSDPEVARFQAWHAPYSEAQAHDLIRSMQGRAIGEDGWTQIAVAAREGDRLLGDLALRAFAPRHAELGFTFARSAQGQGFAREAVSGLLDLAFGALDLHRVVANTDPRNAPSAQLLHRLGFRHEGQAVEAYFDGEAWLGEDQYALLAREWQSQHP